MTDFSSIFDDPSSTPDQKADKAILIMMGGSAALSVIPVYVNWAVFAALVGAGVVAIGRCYGVKIDEKEAWKLIRQFIFAAGFTFMATALGAKFIAAILTATGAGYIVAAPIDAAMSAATAYATGECARAYFKGERNKEELGKTLRAALKDAFNRQRDLNKEL